VARNGHEGVKMDRNEPKKIRHPCVNYTTSERLGKISGIHAFFIYALITLEE